MGTRNDSPQGLSLTGNSNSNANSTLNPSLSAMIVQWDDNDPMHPYSMSLGRKWLTVVTVSMGSLCVACTSSIYSTTYDQIMSEFHCSQEIATLGLSLFIWGMGTKILFLQLLPKLTPNILFVGTGPLIFSPLSEIYGRRVIYLYSLTFFFIWLIPCAVAMNIQTLLIGRFLNGFAGSAFLSVAGGTIGDMFPRHQLALPMMVYTASPFIGPELGPLRWTFYMLLCWAAAMLLLVYFFVPETYQPMYVYAKFVLLKDGLTDYYRLLRRKAQQLRRQTANLGQLVPSEKNSFPLQTVILRSIYRPGMLLALEPMCLCLCIYSALLLGILYLFFGAFQVVFQSVYGFELWQRGLSFLGLLIGMFFAVLSDPYWRWNYCRLEREHQTLNGDDSGFFPEWRLPQVFISGAPLVTIGLFIFAWTTYPSVHWIVPIIGSAFFGAGTILVYSGIFTFLVDAYPSYAASALAANSFTRSTFAGVFPLFGSQSKGKDLKLLVRTILTFSFFGQCTINWVYTGPHVSSHF
ncbi:major facilitator superfamily domain-containing protein [Penicillium samsonianum]|uniref:major facilitator superfamily domain-containing protein n=1 Tax=Penicillium samsonianum TaxID=1882272 RepID=UPI0025490367|nr:major facilitator superfamily domain-containing protein [Penicillium samsonianum]KAJ6148991.1 major facilitator superfamily domain-containing protein [Penicillium samsonianum]